MQHSRDGINKIIVGMWKLNQGGPLVEMVVKVGAQQPTKAICWNGKLGVHDFR